MELGGPLEYIVTLCTGTGGNVNLRCMGKVLRIEENFANGTGGGNFTVAVSLERYEFMRNSHLS